LNSLHDHSVSPGGRIDACRRSARRRLHHPYKKPPLTAIDARAADDGSGTDDSVMVQWPIPAAPVLMNQDSPPVVFQLLSGVMLLAISLALFAANKPLSLPGAPSGSKVVS
jgi:hypothetical protein